MRSFWTFLLVLSLLALTVFLFFVLSVRVRDHITFTDQQQLTTPTVTIADPQLGPADAKVTIVEFGDYQCPSCVTLDTTLIQLTSEFPHALRIVWKDMPNTSVHEESLNAAVAAQCAGEQKQFWDYHALLMQNSLHLGRDTYVQLAQALKLRDNAFARCLDEQTTLPLVQRGFDEGVALGITATPTIYVNGSRYTGSQTQAELRNAIQAAITGL